MGGTRYRVTDQQADRRPEVSFPDNTIDELSTSLLSYRTFLRLRYT